MDIQNANIPRTSIEVAELIATSVDDLWRATRRARRHGYSPFVLKLGSKKRVISAPRDWLKSLQSSLYEKVLLSFPVSDSVYSKRGRNVVLNALQHLGRTHMVVLDIKDCFPSTTHFAVAEALQRIGLEPSAASLITRLVTAKGVLPQGPPTSPQVLNLVLQPLDDALTTLAGQFSATYTRYMDDLCFSADEPLENLVRPTAAILAARGYRINQQKRRVWGPNDPHTVTKIVVTSSLNPNPDYLEALTSALEEYGEGVGMLNRNELLGRISWVNQLNPELGSRLRQRYDSLQLARQSRSTSQRQKIARRLRNRRDG